jgi:hypothetical protein
MSCSAPPSTLTRRPPFTARAPFLKRSFAALALGLGLLGSLLPGASALEPTDGAPLTDGTYLYGEAAEPGEIGATYIVMTVRDGQATGAFYRPSSSFDCFHGQVTNTALNATIINSYDQTAYDYAVALAPSTVASQAGGAPSGLEGFYALDTLSDLDHEILATCQAVVAQ